MTGWILHYGCINYVEWYDNQFCYYDRTRRPVEKVFKVHWTKTSMVVHNGPKKVDLSLVNKMQRDKSSSGRNKAFKWDVNKKHRSCERHQLYKVKESCYNGFNDIHDYDDSFEECHSRRQLWVYW